MKAELATLELPGFGLPTVEPEIPAEIYRQRMDKLRDRTRDAGFQVFVVYGDREHFANLAFLTGYDPRFEEALLVLDVSAGPSSKPKLLVGNEGLGYCRISPIIDELEVVLYQSFSLLGQPRDRIFPLEDVLREAGVGADVTVGVAGWKHFGPKEVEEPELTLEIPSYIADTLRRLSGTRGLVRNANALFMDSQTGLRAQNEVEQIARFEFVGSFSSQAVRNVLFGIRPGMTELEAVRLMGLGGLPFSCHLMLSTGTRAWLGMASPSLRRIETGDAFTTACGLWGSLNARAGFLVEREGDLPSGAADYVERLVAPYFEAVAAWYETVGIGATGGALYSAIHDRIGDSFFGVGLNPGHLVHLDEWVHSPIYKGSRETLRSGMALQVDVIPATGGPYFTTNIEDGIALADQPLQDQLAQRFPEAWTRIQKRRRFMTKSLGLRLKPEVLPFSNIPAYLPPYVLGPERAMRLGSSA
jgi:hypothetical protein